MSGAGGRHYLLNGGETLPDAREALEWASETRVSMVDLKFCDLLGTWQHMTLPLRALDESPSTRGSASTAPRSAAGRGSPSRTCCSCPIRRARSSTPPPRRRRSRSSARSSTRSRASRYGRDPRQVAKRAEEYLRRDRHRRHVLHRPGVRVLRLRRGQLRARAERGAYEVDSGEGYWNSGKPGLGYTSRPKEGYFPAAPHDSLHDLRTAMVLTLERLGIPCEFHHHEVASGGQCEIDLRFQTLTRMADQVMTYKYVVKNVAHAQASR